MLTVRDLLGRSRTVDRVCPDGGYGCPFCAGAVDDRPCSWPNSRVPCPPHLHCQNPACPANPHLDPERVRQQVQAAERRAVEEARQQRDHELAMQRIAEQHQRDADIWAVVREEAVQRGACLTCLAHSDWRSYASPYPHLAKRAHFVRHRNGCPREAGR